MRTTRHQFHSKMRSRAPSKPCLIATFLLRSKAYMPVLEALGRLCRTPGCERLIMLLRQQAPTWLMQMPWLLSAADREALQRELLGATRERMVREMAEAMERLTAQTPLLLVLEDLQWSDYATLDLVAFLAQRREPAGLLLIGTYRPAEVIVRGHPLKAVKQDLQQHGRCEELPLEVLAEAEVAEYLAAGYPGSELSAKLVRWIYQRTEGHPLFMITLGRYLVAQGVLSEHEGRWTLEAALDEVEVRVPDSIRQMIEQQIESLTTEEQRVLEVASVAGMEFSTAAVAAGLTADVTAVEERCEGLARGQQFLRPAGIAEWPDGTVVAGRYVFVHALCQNVVYQRVAVARRVLLHQRIGERLEVAYGNRLGEIAAELAVHCERGRDYCRAVQHLRRAAENAARRYANHEAIGALRRALTLVEQLPEAEQAGMQITVLEQLGLVHRSMGDMKGAAEDFAAMAAYARKQGHVDSEAKALL
jgi:predicted ATPase